MVRIINIRNYLHTTIAQLVDIAEQIKTAQVEALQIAPLTSQVADFDLMCAYAVADLIHWKRVQQGAVPFGRKIGFTNTDINFPSQNSR